MLKNMDYVYAVYLNQSFSKAAKALYISQPALSAAIKRSKLKSVPRYLTEVQIQLV